MHNLALALHNKGETVTGSDDEIFEPSRGRLAKFGLLPESYGWHTEKITSALDAVILGMHAREDNPELLKAKELGLPIYSYPEYLYEQTKDKKLQRLGSKHHLRDLQIETSLNTLYPQSSKGDWHQGCH